MKWQLSLALATLASILALANSLEHQAGLKRVCQLDLVKQSKNPIQFIRVSDIQNLSADDDQLITISIDVFETCNDIYRVSLRSEYGGLGELGGERLIPYEITYFGPDSQHSFPSYALLETGVAVRLQKERVFYFFTKSLIRLKVDKRKIPNEGIFSDSLILELVDED